MARNAANAMSGHAISLHGRAMASTAAMLMTAAGTPIIRLMPMGKTTLVAARAARRVSSMRGK